jgi:hypothetical protein
MSLLLSQLTVVALPDIAAQIVPLSVPTRRKSSHALRQVLAFDAFPLPNPVVDVELGWLLPLTEPIRHEDRKRRAATSRMPSAFWTPVEVKGVSTLDKWFRPLSEPKRRIELPLAMRLSPLVFQSEPIVSFSWMTALTEPKRRRETPLAARLDPQIYQPNPVVPFDWYAVLTEPKRRHEMPRATGPASFTYQPDPVVPFGWYATLSEPKRTRELPRATAPASPIFQDEPIVSFSWFTALREPVRRPPRLRSGAEPQLSFTVLEPVVVFRWFTPLQEPVRPKDKRHIQPRSTFARPPIVSFGWYGALVDPVRPKPRLSPALQPAETTMFVFVARPVVQQFKPNGPLYSNGGGQSFWRGRTRS